MSSEFHTVGQLRALLAGVPDGLPILCQVVATNGQAWNLIGQFNAKTLGNFALMQMKHEELTSLQWPAQETEVRPTILPCGCDPARTAKWVRRECGCLPPDRDLRGDPTDI